MASDDVLYQNGEQVHEAVINFPLYQPSLCANALTLLDAGGGGIRPPYHTFVIPRKKLMGKVANFFLLFLNM